MTNFIRPARERSDALLRALGYLNLMVWAVLFFVFPPNTFISHLAELSRLLWLAIAFTGATMAFVGALTRIDIKLEFPGILLALVGPSFYTISQLYLSVAPLSGVDPTQRFALSAYALLPVTLLLPRAVSLLREKNRLKDAAQ